MSGVPALHRIALAARDRVFRAGIEAIVREGALGRVVSSGARLGEAAAAQRANLVLFDLDLLPPGEVAPESFPGRPRVRYAALARAPGASLPAALDALLDAAILVDGEADELAAGLKALARGERYRSAAFATQASEFSMIDPRNWEIGSIVLIEAAEHGVGLTPRERDVLRLVAAGAKSEAIAFELGVAVATVRKHRENLRAKLHGHNTAQITATAIALRLLEDPRSPSRDLTRGA